MDRFLRELDKAIGSLTGLQRERAVEAIRALLRAAPAFGFLNGISKIAWVQFLGSLVMTLSGDRSPAEWLAKLKVKAEATGEHVSALFSAL